jgi:SAM-dependent methyltransferase
MANTASSFEFARCGPVHFQPVEMEIAPLAPFISGRLLNAGCGHRNIDRPLGSAGAVSVVNYDMESSIPGAIIGMLHEVPFPDGHFDTIFCNAVLEHTPRIDVVMAEFCRLIKPGGHIVVAIPFLQPFHPDPWDFRRYTKMGLEELGATCGLSVKEVLPVHTIAQTLGWIAWEWAVEKGGWRRKVTYPIVWLATRLCYRTDTRLLRNANTFQCVFQKPILSSRQANSAVGS